MYNEKLNAQYEIMTVEQKNEYGYNPNYEKLIAEAPNKEMAQKWRESQELHESMLEEHPRFSAFAYNSVYMVQKRCGHYEIYQHSCRSEEELLDWIENVELKRNMDCTACMCGGL